MCNQVQNVETGKKSRAAWPIEMEVIGTCS